MFEDRILKDYLKSYPFLSVIFLFLFLLILMIIAACITKTYSNEAANIAVMACILWPLIACWWILPIILSIRKYKKIIESMSESEKIKFEQTYLKNKGKFKRITFLDNYILTASEFGPINLTIYSDIDKVIRVWPLPEEGGFPGRILIVKKDNKSYWTYINSREKFTDFRTYLNKYAPHIEIIKRGGK